MHSKEYTRNIIKLIFGMSSGSDGVMGELTSERAFLHKKVAHPPRRHITIKIMKGLILAGGKGTRLLPVTRLVNKHMVPILNTPMIVYPLETLKHLGIKDIMIVSGGEHIGGIAEFLGDGSEFGVNLTYRVQKDAGGIAQALGLAKNFVGKDAVTVILGDNIFENKSIQKNLPKGVGKDGAMFFFSKVKDPSRFGVAVFKGGTPNPFNQNLIAIEEKPLKPKSDLAVTGLYIYPPNVFEIIKTLKPSKRGELEISDVNNWYINKKKCAYQWFPGYWSDAGTVESLKEVINWAYERRT